MSARSHRCSMRKRWKRFTVSWWQKTAPDADWEFVVKHVATMCRFPSVNIP